MMAFRTLRCTCALLAPMCLTVLGAARYAAADTISVGWDQGSSTVGYRVHVGVQSGSYSQHFDVGTATTFAFTTATAGQRYCFAVSAYLLSTRLEGPNSNEVCGYSDAPPTLLNPGARQSTVGQPTSLQLQGSDPQSQPLTYSATGLPPGLSVMSSTGYISGTGTTAGTYTVTARASDGLLSASQTFSWTMTTSSTSSGTTTSPSSGPDYTAPTVSVTAPTTGTSYSTTQSSINVTGIASDTVGVARVVWENTATGARGTASGTTSWTIAGMALNAGTNYIEISAYDAAGNRGYDTLLVTRSSSTTTTPTTPTTSDTTRPTVSVGSPTSGTSYSTSYSTINLTGIASDNSGVARVVWENTATGARGTASGTTSWAVSGIALNAGTNYIEISAYDAAGNRGYDTLLVTRSSTTTSSTGSCPVASTVSICTPTTGTSFTTTQSSINMTGTAPSVIVRVVWENVANGARGVASGTTSWAIASIPLAWGSNLIEVTAYDGAGNPSSDRLVVTR
jgi:hypothetical protein